MTYYGAVNTLIDESIVRFINGDKAMSEYDAFIEQIRDMRVEELIPMYEAAIERYHSRGE